MPPRFSYDFKQASHVMIVLETGFLNFFRIKPNKKRKEKSVWCRCTKRPHLECVHQNEPLGQICSIMLLQTHTRKHQKWFQCKKTFWMNFKVIWTINVKERNLMRGNIVIINWSHPKKDRLYSLTFFELSSPDLSGLSVLPPGISSFFYSPVRMVKSCKQEMRNIKYSFLWI